MRRWPRRSRVHANRIDVRPKRMLTLARHWFRYSPGGQFVSAIGRLIWTYRGYSVAIFLVTIVEEFAALWPVNILGNLIDQLSTRDDVGPTVWLLLVASLLYPALLRGNVILRHMMFYETDRSKMVELVLEAAGGGKHTQETAGSGYTLLANAAAGITNATYHVLGSFTPVVIKIIIVAGSLLRYSRLLGLVYVASLTVPAMLTVVANSRMRRLRDAQYALGGEISGVAMKAMVAGAGSDATGTFVDQALVRKGLLQRLVATSQAFIYSREAVLVGSQFLVVFLALGMRNRLGMSAGDFAKIIGYTSQVAAAFVGAASTLDSVVSFSRAYYVYATGGRLR